jgi:two-component system, OmpR family, sensor kinase
MRELGLRGALLLAIAYVLLLAVLALGIPLALNLRDRVQAEVRSEALGQAEVVAATASDLLDAPRRASLERLAERTARRIRGRVVVVDARGRLIADSEPGSLAGASLRRRPEVAAALSGRVHQRTRESRTLGEGLLATAVPIVRGGRRAGAVRITQSTGAVGRAIRRSLLALALLAAVVLALGLLAAAAFAAALARPMRRLEAAARTIDAGALDLRAPVEGTAEQRSLARSFNDMTERLARLLRSQRDFVADASHQLRTPLAGLRLRLEEARGLSASSEARLELDAALREVDRLAGTVSELLVLTHAGEPELPPEELPLAAVARRAAARWHGLARERGVELEAGEQGVAGVARAAAVDVDRALDALVENAIAYSGGGTVRIVAAPGRLEVLDEGPGLAAGEEEAVFERFHRGRAGTGVPGSGLGLAIARELASRWGGAATIANRPQGGARAVLTWSA